MLNEEKSAPGGEEQNPAQPTQPVQPVAQTPNQTPDQVQTPPPAQTSRFSFRKWPILLLVVLFLILVLGGGYLFLSKKSVKLTPAPTSVAQATPTPDPTAGWKTYTAPSFSIKYPSNLIIDQKFLSNPNDSFVASSSGKNEYISISVELTGIIGKDSNQALADTISFGEKTERFYNSNYLGKTKLDGQTALVYATDKPWAGGNLVGGKPGELPPYKSYVIYSLSRINGSPAVKTIRVEYFATQENSKIFDQMAKTFKFTNSPAQNISAEITEKDNLKTINLKNDSTFSVTLPDPGDGGYKFADPVFDNGVIILSSSTHIPAPTPQPSHPPIMGDFGKDQWIFKAVNMGTTKLDFSIQPFTDKSSKKLQYSFILNVQ